MMPYQTFRSKNPFPNPKDSRNYFLGEGRGTAFLFSVFYITIVKQRHEKASAYSQMSANREENIIFTAPKMDMLMYL